MGPGRVAGKAVIITGAAKGIGRASAELFAREGAFAVEAMGPDGGSIICLSSISGLAGQSNQAVYGPAKFLASGLTKHLAVELAPRKIRVNAVAPGTIRTEAVASLLESYVEPMRAAHPMGRLGEPSEVAEAICFLASDAASFITGVVLPVDGGYLAR